MVNNKLRVIPKTRPHGAARPAQLPRNWLLPVVLSAALLAILGFGGVYSYVWVPVTLFLLCALCAQMGQQAWKGNLTLPPAIFWPMASFFLLVALQWLRFSVYPGITLNGLLQLTGCGAIFLLGISALAAPVALRRFAWVLWLFCGGLGAEAICQFFTSHGYIYWFHNATYATPVGPYVYHNHFAGCMDLLLPVAVMVAFRVERGHEPLWMLWLRRGLAPALGLAAVVVSQSRGGILTLGFEGALSIFVFWHEMRHSQRLKIVGALAGLMLAFASLANFGPLARRLARLGTYSIGLHDRLRVALACWHIFLSHFWLGSGFNTFATIYPAYQLFDNGLIFVFAHNDYAQALAETGFLGALCILAFLALWLAQFARCWREHGHGLETRRLKLAFFIATAGFLFHSLGDFQFHAPANALLFFLFVSAALASPADGAMAKAARAGL